MPTAFPSHCRHRQGILCFTPCPNSAFLPAPCSFSPPTSQTIVPLVPTPKARLGILFLQPFTNSAMIWKEEPLHRASSCTNIVHTLSTLSSVSRGLVGGHFFKLKNKQSLRHTQFPRAGWRVHSCYRHWFLPAKSFQSRGEIGKREEVHCALVTSCCPAVLLECQGIMQPSRNGLDTRPLSCSSFTFAALAKKLSVLNRPR